MSRKKVIVVTGASRGIGKDIALALGETGAMVYVTGRSDTGKTTEGLSDTVRDRQMRLRRRAAAVSLSAATTRRMPRSKHCSGA